MKRDDAWLQALLDDVWDRYFADVVQQNDVKVRFGRRAKRRLGSIALDREDRTTSIITMNGIFRDPEIPEMIIKATLVHELCHYAHGFNSPHTQKHRYPHRGGVMRREFAERGLEDLHDLQKAWLKDHWPAVLAREFPARRRQARPAAKRRRIPKPFWL